MRDRGANRAFVLGVLALPFGLLGPFAALAGWRSLQRVRRSDGVLTGEVRASFGLAAGLLASALLVIGTLAFLVASNR
jgi:hypothetical protein